jgi:hypothetical protein
VGDGSVDLVCVHSDSFVFVGNIINTVLNIDIPWMVGSSDDDHRGRNEKIFQKRQPLFFI